MSDRRQEPRESGLAFSILADPHAIAVLDRVRASPKRPVALERELGLPHASLMRRLDALLAAGALSRERRAGRPPQAHYRVTEAGGQLHEMSRALKLRDSQTARQTDATTAEQITALAQNQNVLGAVLSGADGPRAIAKLSTSSRSQAARRLSQLRSAGLIGPRGELLSISRSYARLLLEALSWDLRGRPQVVANASARLLLTVRLITPLVEHPFPEEATCRLVVTDSPRAKLVLQLRGTQLRASRRCDANGPALEITSSATDWCATLLGDDATRTCEAPGCEQALLTGFRSVLQRQL